MPAPKLMVRRARPIDAEPIAEFVSAATGGRLRTTEDSVLDRMGARGFFVAIAESLVGVAGWTAENLVARIEDFLVHPVSLRPTAGRELLSAVEDAARELECEVALLLVPRTTSGKAVTFYESCGYTFRDPDSLPEAWRDSVRSVISADHFILVKQLRAELVSRPI